SRHTSHPPPFPYTTLFRSYGSGTFIESMTTPYGTTHFSTTGGTSNGNGASIQATDPMGYTERTEYRVQAPSVPFSVGASPAGMRSEEHTSELQSRFDLVCR